MTTDYIFKSNNSQEQVISSIYGFVVFEGSLVGQYINIGTQDISGIWATKAEQIKSGLDYYLKLRIGQDNFKTEIIDSLTVKLTLYNDYKVGFFQGVDFVPDYNTLIYSGQLPGFSAYNALYSKGVDRYVSVSSTVNNGGTTNNQGTFEIPSFNGNGFKINNDILINVPLASGKTITKCELTVTANNVSSGVMVYYANNNEVRIPINQIAKVLMEEPQFHNDYTSLENVIIKGQSLNCQIIIKRFYTTANSYVELFDTYTVNKTFLRAGERGNELNISTQPNTLLKVTEKIPVWDGLPSPFYKLNENYQVERINKSLPDVPTEKMLTNDCDTYYVEFANQEGGFSYWLFRSAKNSRSTTNQGYSNIYGQVKNFGNEENITYEFISKVPARYMPLMHDLAVSPKVRIYNGGNSWTEIIQRGNTLPYATDKRVYDVSFKFEIPTNFNPKPTW